MSVKDWNKQRWVVRDVDRETVDLVRRLAIKHHVRNSEVLSEAIEHFYAELGHSIVLPDGWSKPRVW